MANQISAFIYGENQNYWPVYKVMGFPVMNVLFVPLKPPETRGSLTINSIIKVIGVGNDYTGSPEFYTDKTVDTLVTESNL